MSKGVFFKAAGPIGDTDTNALPVKEIGPAVGYYTQCLGFTLVSKDKTTARLKRDDVEIGLAVNGRDPSRRAAGSPSATWTPCGASTTPRGSGRGSSTSRSTTASPTASSSPSAIACRLRLLRAILIKHITDEVRKFLRSTKDLSPSFVETRDGEAGTN